MAGGPPPCEQRTLMRNEPEPAYLVLEDGAVYEGEAFGAAGVLLWRGRLQYVDDRVPGDADGPVVRRTDRRAHLPPDRQLRGSTRGTRVEPDTGLGVRGARALPPPQPCYEHFDAGRVHAFPGGDRSERRRHPRRHAAAAEPGRHDGSDRRGRAARRGAGEAQGAAGLRDHRLRVQGHDPQPVRVGWGRRRR